MKTFPILQRYSGGGAECPDQITSIPWELIAPHEDQALRNHCGQSLKRLAQRGGLSPCEAVAVLEDSNYNKRWPLALAISSREQMTTHNEEATKRLRELCASFTPE